MEVWKLESETLDGLGIEKIQANRVWIDRYQHPAEPDIADLPVDSPRSLNPDDLWTPVWRQACSLRLEPTREYSALFNRVFSPTLVRSRPLLDAQLLLQKLLPIFEKQQQGRQIDLLCHREVDWDQIATPPSSFWDTDPEDSPSFNANRKPATKTPSPPAPETPPSTEKEKPPMSNQKRKLDHETSNVDATNSDVAPQDGINRRSTRSCKRRCLVATTTEPV